MQSCRKVPPISKRIRRLSLEAHGRRCKIFEFSILPSDQDQNFASQVCVSKFSKTFGKKPMTLRCHCGGVEAQLECRSWCERSLAPQRSFESEWALSGPFGCQITLRLSACPLSNRTSASPAVVRAIHSTPRGREGACADVGSQCRGHNPGSFNNQPGNA